MPSGQASGTASTVILRISEKLFANPRFSRDATAASEAAHLLMFSPRGCRASLAVRTLRREPPHTSDGCRSRTRQISVVSRTRASRRLFSDGSGDRGADAGADFGGKGSSDEQLHAVASAPKLARSAPAKRGAGRPRPALEIEVKQMRIWRGRLAGVQPMHHHYT